MILTIEFQLDDQGTPAKIDAECTPAIAVRLLEGVIERLKREIKEPAHD